MARINNTLNIENAKIIYRNFKGAPSAFNKNGAKSFHVVIEDPKLAEQLKRDGWNVKTKILKDGDYFHHIEVTIRFDVFPPLVYMITGNKKTLLDDESIECLDYAELQAVDLIIRPRTWETADGKTGIKAYLKTGYFVIEQDAFAHKYADEEYPQE